MYTNREYTRRKNEIISDSSENTEKLLVGERGVALREKRLLDTATFRITSISFGVYISREGGDSGGGVAWLSNNSWRQFIESRPTFYFNAPAARSGITYLPLHYIIHIYVYFYVQANRPRRPRAGGFEKSIGFTRTEVYIGTLYEFIVWVVKTNAILSLKVSARNNNRFRIGEHTNYPRAILC